MLQSNRRQLASEISAEKATTEGAWLRTQACQHIEKHKIKFINFYAVQKRAETTPFDSWLQKAGKRSTWTDGLIIQALSEKLGCPTVVWKQNGDNWERYCFAPKFSRGMARSGDNWQPLCVILKNKHYLSLRGPEKGSHQVPKEWLQETPGHFRATLSGAGLRSIATPSVKSGSSLSRVLQGKELPTPTVHSDIATPSVKTVPSRTQSGRVPSVRSKFGKKEKAGGTSKKGGCSQVTFSGQSNSIVDERSSPEKVMVPEAARPRSWHRVPVGELWWLCDLCNLEVFAIPGARNHFDARRDHLIKNMDSKPLTSAFLKTTEREICSFKSGTN